MNYAYHRWVDTVCTACGLTRGRYHRAYANTGEYPRCARPDTDCGHPVAARMVVGNPIRTACWACRIEAGTI